MTNEEYEYMLLDMLACSRTWRAWFEPYNSNGFAVPTRGYIHIVRPPEHYVISVDDGAVEIDDFINTAEETEYVALNDPEAFSRLLARFDVDENSEPKKVDPLEIMVELL